MAKAAAMANPKRRDVDAGMDSLLPFSPHAKPTPLVQVKPDQKVNHRDTEAQRKQKNRQTQHFCVIGFLCASVSLWLAGKAASDSALVWRCGVGFRCGCRPN